MLLEKLQYLFWALKKIAINNDSCPFCGNIKNRIIFRKYLVTSLWECNLCGLRFRIPKSKEQESIEFYQSKYQEGFTTDCPVDSDLKHLVSSKFIGSPKDFKEYIKVLKLAGLSKGDSILDFGCSWGYGSWQMREAGFNVYSYEISKHRALYARTKLGCKMIDEISDVTEKVNCFFSAHVIEHLNDPNIMWQAAIRVLTPKGMVVCFCPNGEPNQEKILGSKLYHQLWGVKHPLLITKRSLVEMSKLYGFQAHVFSSPYKADQLLSLQESDQVTGSELLLIAFRH